MNQPLTMNYYFDATKHQPDTTQDPIPAGEYLFEITNTEVVAWSEGKGMAFRVHSKVVDGNYKDIVIRRDFGLWYTGDKQEQTIEIAHKKLTSLCLVTGVMGLDMGNAGAALRGTRFRGTVGNDGQYNEIKYVKDVNGNKPGQSGQGFAPAQTAPAAVVTPQHQPQFPQQAPAQGGFAQQQPPAAYQPPMQAQAPQGWAPAAQYPTANQQPPQPQYQAPAQPQVQQQYAAAPQPAPAPAGWAPQGGFAAPAGVPGQQGPWGAPTA